PLTVEARMLPFTAAQSRVMALVIVTAPNPPGSRQSISPPRAVFEIAPANVLQGAVRLQGLASSPTPETQVRVACAWAGTAETEMASAVPKTASVVAKSLFTMYLRKVRQVKVARLRRRTNGVSHEETDRDDTPKTNSSYTR